MDLSWKWLHQWLKERLQVRHLGMVFVYIFPTSLGFGGNWNQGWNHWCGRGNFKHSDYFMSTDFSQLHSENWGQRNGAENLKKEKIVLDIKKWKAAARAGVTADWCNTINKGTNCFVQRKEVRCFEDLSEVSQTPLIVDSDLQMCKLFNWEASCTL